MHLKEDTMEGGHRLQFEVINDLLGSNRALWHDECMHSPSLLLCNFHDYYALYS